MSSNKKTVNSQGFALLVVLMVLLLVSALAAEMIFTTRAGTQAAYRATINTQSRGLALAGINMGLFFILDTPFEQDEDSPYIPGLTSQYNLPTGQINFQVINESGKVDLNRINRKLLSQLLMAYDYNLHEQEVLIDSMQDWRDQDNLHRLNGAENDYYEALIPPYKAKNRLFTDVEELSLVRGATKLTKQVNITDIFTVYNSSGRINFNMLSNPMLETMTDGDAQQIKQYLELKKDGILFGTAHAKQILGNNYSKWQPYLAYSRSNNQHYTIMATGFAKATSSEQINEVPPKKTKVGHRIRLLLKKEGARLEYIRWGEEIIVE